MPIVSRFLGITIVMFYADHQPAHFHARYGDAEVLVEIDSGKVHGEFPLRALRLVLEWRSLHLQELQEDWKRCLAQEPLHPIAPLE
ncbi:MAG: hypothetical protein RLZZ11_1692 [Cyanobacteriota bacterium]|jgi:hypothetical protein